MSDSRRRYRAIKAGLMQLYPQGLTGRAIQRLNVLAMFISGIVGSGSTHLRQVAKKAPTGAKVESRIKQCCGIEKVQVRSAVAQRNHIGLALRVFLRLERFSFVTGISWCEAKTAIIRRAVAAYLA